MIVVERSGIPLEWAQLRVGALRGRLETSLSLAGARVEALMGIGPSARAYAGFLSVADPDPGRLRGAVQLGSRAMAGVFALAAARPGEVVAIDLGRAVRARLPGTGPADMADAGSWLEAFWLAAVARRRADLDGLCAVPAAVLRASSTRADAYVYVQVEALRAFWAGTDGEAALRLRDALALTGPALLPDDAVGYALDVAVPELDLLYRLLDRDAPAFNRALATALERHRVYWGREDPDGRDSRGYVAWGPLALAVLASEAGMPIEVASGYLPRALLAWP